MRVILLERIARIGQMGEVVDVKPGYARNFLLPNGKALEASKANIQAFEDQKAALEARNLETRKEAESIAKQMVGQEFTIIRSASDAGTIYGSVSPRDIAEVTSSEGISIDKKQVAIVRPIKELGIHSIDVLLHPEVVAEIKVNVARSEEEARLQSSGWTVQELAAGEEAAPIYEISGYEASDLADETASQKTEVDAATVHQPTVSTYAEAAQKDQVDLERFISGFTHIQQVEISATAQFVSERVAEISKKEKRISRLLGLR